MQTYIALFRGINVGGHNILPMKELKVLFENLGAEEVKTYIQSGNVVLEHNEKNSVELKNKITTAIKNNFGFEPNVLLLKQSDVKKVLDSNPFPEAEENPKTLHAYFLETKPTNPNFAKMDEVKIASEKYKLIDKIFYLYTPDGFGKSKLASVAEKLIGVPATARNWRTVNKIKEMIDEVK